MTLEDPPDRGERLWAEAAASLQAELVADVHDEARGLIVAEMADVSLAERARATAVGRPLRVVVNGGTALGGELIDVGRDHLILADGSTYRVIPMHALALAEGLSRVVHNDEPQRPGPSWRHALRSHLGRRVVVEVAGQHTAGVVTWVGHDHLDLRTDHGAVTIAWALVSHLATSVDADAA